MGSRSFALVADVSSADSAAIEPVLRGLIDGEIIPTVNGFHVAATLRLAPIRPTPMWMMPP